MNVLSNPWFVGIITGLISGLLVYFSTNWIIKRKNHEEYRKQVSKANERVISALKPYIAERVLPKTDLFMAMLASYAREYEVDVKDMYSIPIVCEEIIREIIGDVYVSADKKEEYTKAIISYKRDLLKYEDMDVSRVNNSQGNSTTCRVSKVLTAYIGVLVAVMGIMFILLVYLSGTMKYEEYTQSNIKVDGYGILAVGMTVFATVMTIMSIIVLDRAFKKKIRHIENKRFKSEVIKKELEKMLQD